MSSIRDRIVISTNSVASGKELIAKSITENLGGSATKDETFKSLSDKIKPNSELSSISLIDIKEILIDNSKPTFISPTEFGINGYKGIVANYASSSSTNKYLSLNTYTYTSISNAPTMSGYMGGLVSVMSGLYYILPVTNQYNKSIYLYSQPSGTFTTIMSNKDTGTMYNIDIMNKYPIDDYIYFHNGFTSAEFIPTRIKKFHKSSSTLTTIFDRSINSPVYEDHANKIMIYNDYIYIIYNRDGNSGGVENNSLEIYRVSISSSTLTRLLTAFSNLGSMYGSAEIYKNSLIAAARVGYGGQTGNNRLFHAVIKVKPLNLDTLEYETEYHLTNHRVSDNFYSNGVSYPKGIKVEFDSESTLFFNDPDVIVKGNKARMTNFKLKFN